MNNFQRNTIRSFRRVKEDIRNLQAQITELSKSYEDLIQKLNQIKTSDTTRKVIKRKN
ncbi:MAG: hypothetical protein QXW97_04035 [Candidatus Pacearchaeota archaeon]